MPAKKPTAEAIRRARLAAGLTQQQVADLIGYSRRTVQEWEAGRRNIRGLTFVALIEVTSGKR